MSRHTRSIARLAAVALLALGVVPAAAASSVAATDSPHPIEAVPKRRLSLTVNDGAGLTLLVVTRTGRTIGAKAITDTPAQLVIDTARVGSLAGTTLQLVNSRQYSAGGTLLQRSGDYFGPVVLGWGASTRTGSGTVYTKLKGTTATTLNLGTIQVRRLSGSKQGHAHSTTNALKSTLLDTRLGQGSKATRGVPKGVGTYGRTNTGDGTPTTVSSTSSHRIETIDSSTAQADQTIGGDLDDDGIPNAFDVNDDGDLKTDSADSSTPNPTAIVENILTGAACSSVDFRIFTNLKATAPNLAGTINAYGPTAYQATPSVSASTVSSTMSMVFSPITQVCGQPVTKTELRGVGVSYAPLGWVELPNTCGGTGDYQWSIGSGRMCAGSPEEFTFGAGVTFTASNMPSGQDTFAMRVTTSVGVYEFTTNPGFVFVTHPMVIGWATTADATVPSAGSFTSIDYATTDFNSNYPQISVGSAEFLHLQLYRPQRLAFDGEVPADGSPYIDLGGFKYTPDIPNMPGGLGAGPGKCDAQTRVDGQMLRDNPITPDTPRVLVVTWKLGDCFGTWPGGAEGDFDIQVEPTGPGGNSAQKIRIDFI
jgi:hypothetical protein